MKRTKLRFVWFVLILLALVGILLHTRMNSTHQVKHRIYRQWTKHYVVPFGEQAYVKTTNSKTEDVVLSESQGYGMVIAVEAAKNGQANREDFEKLYQYYLSHRLEGTQLMSWRQTVKDGQSTQTDTNNATDGDLYIAYALIQAAKQWPEQAETYQTQARAILDDILRYNYSESNGILTVGNWANAESRFHNLMRTSDTLPEQFQAFYDLTQNEQWLTIKDNMLDKLDKVSLDYKTGLIPDFIWVEGDIVRVASANDIESENDGFYSYNALRLPYNLARSKDQKSQKILKKMMTFFNQQEILFAGYDLSGKALTQQQSSSFIAPIVYAANTDSRYQRLVQRNKYIFLQDLPTENYYDAAMISMVALGML